MNPKHLLVLICLLSSLVLNAQQDYNILWITVEDMSPRLGCYGDGTVSTPNIDRLAREGIRYNRAFATYGVCAPSRHSLIMGMYPSSTGAMAMRTWTRTSAIKDITDTALLNIPVYEATPPPEAHCFTEYLRAAGFYCTNNSKTDYQFRPPVTAWDESSNQAHYRHRPDGNQRFFAVFNNTKTHESQIHNPTAPVVTDPATVTVPPYYPDTETVRQDIAHHYDNIHEMDKWVGKIMDELEADGLLDKTIIFFFGDHGDGLPRAKRWVYDSGIQVPLIVRWPDGRRAGTVNEELVSFIDFAPTVLSLAGLAIPDHMEGQAFLGDQKAAERKYIYAFRDRMDPAPEQKRAVRDKRYKYIRNYRPDLPYIGFIPYRDRMLMMQEIMRLDQAGKLGPDQWQFSAKHKPLEELYDTQVDPYEIHNLAADPQYFGKLAELRQAHEDFIDRFGDLGQLTETQLIRHLWGPTGEQPLTAAPSMKKEQGKIVLSSASEGASIAYRWAGSERWELYYRPIPVRAGQTLETQAIRLGWKKSEVRTFSP
ncbi:sulfatase [Flavilitoribacter nigricans DSM 23189 = NBRC 102662]|uniref:Sulfatase n=2 Tax=Flavilitoribacter TaxID=2762562 RepID=A0A2D0NBW6_FLAN2|nr:sulfatase [Flavilitoribacter nigricans DSM 23189 = NBRC 102662]